MSDRLVRRCSALPPPSAFGAKRMLLAGHIKPWNDDTPSERVDRNELAVCPAHDVAFDTGLRAVNGRLRTRVAHSLAAGVTLV